VKNGFLRGTMHDGVAISYCLSTWKPNLPVLWSRRSKAGACCWKNVEKAHPMFLLKSFSFVPDPRSFFLAVLMHPELSPVICSFGVDDAAKRFM